MLVLSIKKNSVEEVKKLLDYSNISYSEYENFKAIIEVEAELHQLPDSIVQRTTGIADVEEEIEINNTVSIPNPGKADLDNYEDNASDVQSLGANSQHIKYSERARVQSDNWGLGRIGTRPTPYSGGPSYQTTYNYEKNGEGVQVFVIDTGVDTEHPEFEGRASTLYGTDDNNGHGTHVASTIAGKKYGVAKKATVYGVQVLDAGGRGTFRSILKGINEAINHHRTNDVPSVANMSLGAKLSSTLNPLHRAVEEMIEAGIPVVVAAGNSGDDLDESSVYSPAEVEKALTVGAADINDKIANFSNFGSAVDVYGPGVNITAAYKNSRIANLSGTSMASPHTAGVVVQMMQDKKKPSSIKDVKAISRVLVDQTTKGKITWDDTYSDTPNRVLYMGFLNADQEEPQDTKPNPDEPKEPTPDPEPEPKPEPDEPKEPTPDPEPEPKPEPDEPKEPSDAVENIKGNLDEINDHLQDIMVSLEDMPESLAGVQRGIDKIKQNL